MEQFKRVKVVMLPTNEKAIVGILALYRNINRYNDSYLDIVERIEMQDYLKIWTSNGLLTEGKGATVKAEYQHLYVLSTEKIKEGDWVFHLDSKTILKYDLDEKANNTYKKIIATTDDSLGFSFKVNHGASTTTTFTSLPRPSQQFIKKYVESYNKGNVITDVLVEYEDIIYNPEKEREYQSNDRINLEDCDKQFRLKINPKDNTITIKKVKDSWNREEVIELIYKYCKEMTQCISEEDEKWIEENL